MKPMIEIRNIPIDIEVKIKRASLELNKEAEGQNIPMVHISREKGGFNIDARPLKINVQNQNYDGFGEKRSVVPVSSEYDDSITLSYQGLVHISGEIPDSEKEIFRNLNDSTARVTRSIEQISEMLNMSNPDVSWDNNKLSVNYTADKLSMEFKERDPKFKFNPGSIEFIVNQLPKVEIEYLGDPIYFPASADPNYKG